MVGRETSCLLLHVWILGSPSQNVHSRTANSVKKKNQRWLEVWNGYCERDYPSVCFSLKDSGWYVCTRVRWIGNSIAAHCLHSHKICIIRTKENLQLGSEKLTKGQFLFPVGLCSAFSSAPWHPQFTWIKK